MVAWFSYVESDWRYPNSYVVVDDACAPHAVVVSALVAIAEGVGRAGVHRSTGIPCPAHSPERYPYPVPAAGTEAAIAEGMMARGTAAN